MHQELLRIALDLATREAGYPRWVARSRSVSTSYYALFHALAELCARQLVGAWRPWQPFRHIYRSLDHGNAKRAFADMRKAGALSTHAAMIGEAFRELQEARHSADYDLGYRVSRVETVGWVQRAEDAIALIDKLDPEEQKLLAARLIGRTRS